MYYRDTNPTEFGRLLTQAIHQLALPKRRVQKQPIAAVGEKLAAKLHVSVAYIRKWQAGKNIPDGPILEDLVRELAQQQALGQPDLASLLKAVAYPDPERYAAELLAEGTMVIKTTETTFSQTTTMQVVETETVVNVTESGETMPPTFLLPRQRLFGIAKPLQLLQNYLLSPTEPYILTIEGLGGLGKTSLANLLWRDLKQTAHFVGYLWITARQQSFDPLVGLQAVNSPILNPAHVVNELLSQIAPTTLSVLPFDQKVTELTRHCHAKPYLIVLDNLETMADIETLMPLLGQLAAPTKFLLTSRQSLATHPAIFAYPLTELSPTDSFNLLRYQGQLKNLPMLASATNNQLQPIYEVVGGHPLALELVAGQLTVAPLPDVLAHLQQARGQTNVGLYRFIYEQSWHKLTLPAQNLLLALTIPRSLERLRQLSGLSEAELQIALPELVKLSLVQVRPVTLDSYKYSLHRLTETFLLTEILNYEMWS